LSLHFFHLKWLQELEKSQTDIIIFAIPDNKATPGQEFWPIRTAQNQKFPTHCCCVLLQARCPSREA